MHPLSTTSRRRLRRAATLLALALPAAIAPAPAGATIAPARALDGPSGAIIDVDGAAMAPDGSGGIVYRKLLNGEPHVFVVRYAGGAWSRPIQADLGQANAATFPAIAAGKGGRLLVVWAEPWAVLHDGKIHFQLESAVLARGADGFGQAIQVDHGDIGDGTAAYPSLAMAPNGAAYVAYRVVTDPLSKDQPLTGIQPMRPGDELVDVRVARFNGLTWSDLPAVNRLPGQVTMRRPSALNAPVVGVAPDGNGIVVWQEPDSTGVARIWARRLFGTVPGVVLPVSPAAIGGAQLTTDADAPSVAFSTYEAAAVAFRLQGGAGSPFATPHVLLDTLPSELDQGGTTFAGATDVDGGAGLGPPSVALDDNEDVRIAYAAGGAAHVAAGAIGAPLGTPAADGPASDASMLTTIDPDGGGVAAWDATDDAGRPVVAAQQDFPSGQWQRARLSAPLSGPIDGLAVGQSGLGDALIAFRQGAGSRVQVAGAIAKAPPGTFQVSGPSDWIRGSAAVVRWDPAPNAIGHVRYAVLVDGAARARRLTARRYRIHRAGLGDGVHLVQVLATDAAGQQTMSSPIELKVDASPPRVTVRALGHRRVLVRIIDTASGVARGATHVSFGDGSPLVRGRVRIVHAYAHGGRVLVLARVRDHVGNGALWRLRVEVR
jgi:hypothetical protein